MIFAGGYNIYPKEIESVIDDMPGVVECAVIGVPHPDFGETIIAIIVAESVTDAQVNDWVAERLARYKHPRRIAFVESLPRNAMGKVQKAELRSQFSDSL